MTRRSEGGAGTGKAWATRSSGAGIGECEALTFIAGSVVRVGTTPPWPGDLPNWHTPVAQPGVTEYARAWPMTESILAQTLMCVLHALSTPL